MKRHYEKTWRDYLSPLSRLMKCPHLVISTCDESVVWSSSCFKEPHLHAFYYKLKQKDPRCAYPFEEMLHISLIAYIHTHKNRRAHTSNEDRNLAVSLLSSASVAANSCQEKFEVLSFIASLDWTAPGSPAHIYQIISLALCCFDATNYKMLTCTFYTLWWSCILRSVMS